MGVLAFVAHNFVRDATVLCSPPRETAWGGRPLVEYYVHGRGRGHYSRSVAIIEELKASGVDVRMFIGRAAMWKEMQVQGNETRTREDVLWEHGWLRGPWNTVVAPVTKRKSGEVGVATAISVTSIVPRYSFSSTVSHIVERLTGDCEVALQSSRYPLLVVSDGDLPGMLRAKLGGIPSVSLSHGMSFAIANPPQWFSSKDKQAWKSQATLNNRAGYFSNWQIGTNLMMLESTRSSAVVAKPVIRVEVVEMEKERRASRMRGGSRDGRKVVVCYFRDHNGDGVVDGLLEEGLDVVLFNPSTHLKEPNQLKNGQKWYVPPRKGTHDSKFKENHDISHPNKDNRSFTSADEDQLELDLNKPRLIPVTDKALFVSFMAMADGIVSSAGSQLLSECLFARIPVLALCEENDGEQVLNMRMAKKVTVGSRTTRLVYGTSLEDINTAEGGPRQHPEFISFMKEVDRSGISNAYYAEIASDRRVVETNKTSDDEGEDMWKGMPDAAEVVLEIVKELKESKYGTTFTPRSGLRSAKE